MWIAGDVAKVLGYSATAAMTRTLDADERGCIICTSGQKMVLSRKEASPSSLSRGYTPQF
nr:hypothetical protein [Corynebacterium ulcerans]